MPIKECVTEQSSLPDKNTLAAPQEQYCQNQKYYIMEKFVFEDTDAALSMTSRDNVAVVSPSLKSEKIRSLKALRLSQETHNAATVRPSKSIFRHVKDSAKSPQEDDDSTRIYVQGPTSLHSDSFTNDTDACDTCKRPETQYKIFRRYETPFDSRSASARSILSEREVGLLNHLKGFSSSARRRHGPTAYSSDAIEDVRAKTSAQHSERCWHCNADISEYIRRINHYSYMHKRTYRSDKTRERLYTTFLECPECLADLTDVLGRSDYICSRCGTIHALQLNTGLQARKKFQRPASKAFLELTQHTSPDPGGGGVETAESKEQWKQTKYQSQTEQKSKPKETRQTRAATTSTIERIKKWNKKCIRDIFPDLQRKSYLVPPIAFNVCKRTAHEGIKNCYIYETTPQSSTRADEARDRVFSAISESLPRLYKDRPTCVISNIAFEDYLHKYVPQELSKTEKQAVPLPRPDDMDPKYRRGEVDVLILVKDYGLIILDIKAVGDTLAEIHTSDEEESKVIIGVLEKSLHQMRKEKEVIMHLVSDINTCTIPVSCVLVLPNLRRQQLTKALAGSPDLRKELQACMRKSGDVEDVCLCADDLPSKHQPATLGDLQKIMGWWTKNFPAQSTIGSQVTDEAYEDIVGRFCGNLSTISVWTPDTPRAEVRTLGQAVSETARRFSSLVLTPQQLRILDSQDPIVFLRGPPGSGKTLLLVLKAAHWLKGGGNYVCILSLRQGPSPGALVMEQQIKQTLSQFKEQPKVPIGDDVDLLTVLEPGSPSLSASIKRFAMHLRERSGGRPMLVIMDDLQAQGREVLGALKNCLTPDGQLGQGCAVWSAGAWARNCPYGFKLEDLSVAMRCPPAVQSALMLVEPPPSAEEPSPYSDAASCSDDISASSASFLHMSEGASALQPADILNRLTEFVATALTASISLSKTSETFITKIEPIHKTKTTSQSVATQSDMMPRTSDVSTVSSSTIQPEVMMSHKKSLITSETISTQTDPIDTPEATTVLPTALREMSKKETYAILRPILESFFMVGRETTTALGNSTSDKSVVASEATKASTEYRYVTSSTDTSHELGIPLHTTGLRVKLLDHQCHANLAVLACVQCAERLARYLNNDLGVGRDLLPEDIIILISDIAALKEDSTPVFAEVLGQKMGVNIEIVVNYNGSQKQLAFPTKGSITLTSVQFATGLRNKVVVFIPEGNPGPEAENISRLDTLDVGIDSGRLDSKFHPKGSSADEERNDDDYEKSKLSSLVVAVGDPVTGQSSVPPEEQMVRSSSSEEDDDRFSCASFTDVDKINIESATASLQTDKKTSFETSNLTQTWQPDWELMSHDERLRQAVKRLSQRNRDRMWYAVSRALGHAIIFTFQDEDLSKEIKITSKLS